MKADLILKKLLLVDFSKGSGGGGRAGRGAGNSFTLSHGGQILKA